MIPDLLKATENYGVFTILNKSTVSDGYGGYYDQYTAGATFEGVLSLDDSIQAQQAMSQGVTGVYTLTCEKSLHLPWHTVIRKGDQTYRVTSKDENSTPTSSPLGMRVVKCEEWVIPDE